MDEAKKMIKSSDTEVESLAESSEDRNRKLASIVDQKNVQIGKIGKNKFASLRQASVISFFQCFNYLLHN